jgi:transcription termination/antitermination protein NusA
MVVSELRGEKIDIIPFNEEPARFVAKALSPARVREVLVDDENKQATVIVPDDQLSLAIGKEGQNARLAARLTGWRVDIRSETEFAADDSELGYEDEDVSGRCAAILSNGKRCPNAALPGSHYCGLPAHQALEKGGEAPAASEPAAQEEEAPAASEPAAQEGEAPAASEPAAQEEVVASSTAEAPAEGSQGAEGSEADAAAVASGPSSEAKDLGPETAEPATPSGAADSVEAPPGASVTAEGSFSGSDPEGEYDAADSDRHAERAEDQA